MRAIQFSSYGGADVVQLNDVPRPAPGPGEILVCLAATSVNPVDWKIREGALSSFMPIVFPFVPGWDAAGRIEALGEGVSGLEIGSEILGILGMTGGGYADYAVLRADLVVPRPPTLSMTHAAALPLAALTAWQALYRAGDLKPGQRVLIHAGAGGVGHLAVQFAHQAGAYVIATGSAANRDFISGLGADEIIDYRIRSFECVVKDIDLVIDLVGGEVQKKSFLCLRRGGLLVSVVGPPPAEWVPADKRASFIAVQPDATELKKITDLVISGAVLIDISEVMPLERARDALDLSKAGHTRGKIVLTMAG